MDHSDQGHGEHSEVHLPDPSIWPLVAGLAAFILGGALIYYSHNRHGDFAGLFLGAAAVVALIAGCGWAYEDGRMKRKAEEGTHGGPREARYTQVVTFAIPEGQYLAARADGGVIDQLETSEHGLRDLDGFQDLRVIASPAETGPSQVLVETTWADREGLATYDETRQTVLDLLAQHDDQVAPGSVQVFDMEVIRDTKDVSFNFGTGAVAATFGALIVGGFMVGAGLNMFASEDKGGTGGEPTAGPSANNVITAKNTKFVGSTNIEAPPNTDITLVFDNQDASPPHNVEVFAGSGYSGALLTGCTAGCDGSDVKLPVKAGPAKISFTFKTPGAGTYAFNCEVHPVEMRGTLTVKEGAAVPGAAAPAAGGSATPGASATAGAK